MGALIKIGKSTVGLRGLDGAVTDVMKINALSPLSPQKATEIIMEKIEQLNYIPVSARERYMKAVTKFWLDRKSGRRKQPEHGVRILGPGCVGCKRLEQLVLEIFSKSGIAADIEHVHELDEIWRYGVEHTPALVLGDRVVCSGKIPSKAQLEEWIRDFTAMGDF